jgi:hypothetical protein
MAKGRFAVCCVKQTVEQKTSQCKKDWPSRQTLERETEMYST